MVTSKLLTCQTRNPGVWFYVAFERPVEHLSGVVVRWMVIEWGCVWSARLSRDKVNVGRAEGLSCPRERSTFREEEEMLTGRTRINLRSRRKIRRMRPDGTQGKNVVKEGLANKSESC